jgi:hypothetical protein
MMHHGQQGHFFIHAENGKEQYEKMYGIDSYERRILGIEYLCHYLIQDLIVQMTISILSLLIIGLVSEMMCYIYLKLLMMKNCRTGEKVSPLFLICNYIWNN